MFKPEEVDSAFSGVDSNLGKKPSDAVSASSDITTGDHFFDDADTGLRAEGYLRVVYDMDPYCLLNDSEFLYEMRAAIAASLAELDDMFKFTPGRVVSSDKLLPRSAVLRKPGSKRTEKPSLLRVTETIWRHDGKGQDVILVPDEAPDGVAESMRFVRTATGKIQKP